MSISTSPNTTHGSPGLPASSSAQLVPIAPDEFNSKAERLDTKEESLKSGATIIKLEEDTCEDALARQIKRRKEDDQRDQADQGAAESSESSAKPKVAETTLDNDALASKSPRLVPPIVCLQPIEKQQGGLQQQPFIVTGHIVEQQPSSSLARETMGSIASQTKYGSNVEKISNTLSSSSMVTKNNSNNNLWKVIGANQTNILTKTSQATSSAAAGAASAKKAIAPKSRPDLVASSISALHAGNNQNQARSRPLLMSHNQHLYPNHYQQLPGSVVTVSNQATLDAGTKQQQQQQHQNNSNKFDASKAIATTLSSQLILSSIITANPTLKTQQLTSGANLGGLQAFCFSAAPQSGPQTVSLAKSAQPSTASNLITGSLVPTTTAAAAAATTTTTNNADAIRPASANCVPFKSKAGSSPHGSAKSKGSRSSSTEGIQQAQDRASPSAAGSGSNAAAARLLDLGKKLLEATKVGDVNLVRELVVDSGAPFTSDWLDTTALHIAAQNGSKAIAEILVQGGINKDARTKLKRTALHLAAQSGSLEVADLLIKNGSEVNCRDMLEMTPLHWATERGHLPVVSRLLLAHADCKLKSKFRLTALDIARNAGFSEIVELLKNWTSGETKIEDTNPIVYQNLETTSNAESQDFLDIDYHLALVDSANNSRDDSILDTQEPCLDLVELEWNKFDFAPDLFLPNNEEEQNVGYLMKIVEELQRENQQLRQKVEQLSTADQ